MSFNLKNNRLTDHDQHLEQKQDKQIPAETVKTAISEFLKEKIFEGVRCPSFTCVGRRDTNIIMIHYESH